MFNPQTIKSNNQLKLNAEKALRCVNSNFSVASATKWAKFSVVQNNINNQDVVRNLISMMKLMRMRIISSELNDSPIVFYEKFMKTLKKHCIGNCGELVKIFNFILDLNGVKSEKALLCPSSLNHCVSIIPLKKDSFDKINFKTTPLCKMKDILIADPWLDVVDSAQNVATLYKNNYNYAKFLGDYKTAVNKDEYFPNENLSDIYLHPVYGSQHPISEDARNHFRGSNPELFFDIK